MVSVAAVNAALLPSDDDEDCKLVDGTGSRGGLVAKGGSGNGAINSYMYDNDEDDWAQEDGDIQRSLLSDGQSQFVEPLPTKLSKRKKKTRGQAGAGDGGGGGGGVGGGGGGGGGSAKLDKVAIAEYSLVYLLVKLVVYALFFWLPFYLQRELGWTAAKASKLSSFNDLGTVIGGALAGLLSDRIFSGRRIPVIVGMLALSVPSLFLYRQYGVTPASNSALMVLVGLMLGGPAVLIASSCAVDIAQQGGGREAVSTVAGLIDGFGSIGAGAAQFLVVSVQQRVAANRGDAKSWDAVFYMLQARTTRTA